MMVTPLIGFVMLERTVLPHSKVTRCSAREGKTLHSSDSWPQAFEKSYRWGHVRLRIDRSDAVPYFGPRNKECITMNESARENQLLERR